MTAPPGEADALTIADLLHRRAHASGDALAFAELDRHGDVRRRATFADLDVAARRIASQAAAVAPPGTRVVLVSARPLDFVELFFGLLYAGAIPVPAPTPANTAGLYRLLDQARDCEATCLAAPPDLAATLARDARLVSGLAVQGLAAHGPAEPLAAPHPSHPDGIAFLQYTSGSVGRPKGAIVTHAALMANQRMIAAAFGHDATTVFGNWLPLFHDMGLVGGVLQPVFLGIPCYLLTPLQFLARPALWLEAIGRYRITTSGGPNFAYELLCDRAGALHPTSFDLSSWSLAFNGAEPVRAATLDRFARTFARAGLRRDAVFPCYGLAEATLLVSGGPPARGWRVFGDVPGGGPRVGCGCPAPGLDVRIVCPETGTETAGEGEIWVAGPSLARGYWGRPSGGDGMACGTLPDRPGARFLRTGDLGVLADGEVVPTGRLKDLVVVNGQNHHPEDLEEAALSAMEGPRFAAAAFGVDDPRAGTQRATVLLEAPAGLPEAQARRLAAAAGRAVLRESGLAAVTVAVAPGERLPRTTSGKVRRSACRCLVLDGTHTQVHVGAGEEDQDDDTVPAAPGFLEACLARHLGRPPTQTELEGPFAALGIGSLDTVALCASLELVDGRPLDPEALFEAPSLLALAATVHPRHAPPTPPVLAAASAGARALYALWERFPDRSADHLSVAFKVPPGTAEHVVHALAQAVRDTPALLARFDPQGPAPTLLPGAPDRVAIRHRPLLPGETLSDAVEEVAREPFDLRAGNAVRVCLHLGGEPACQLVAHHAVADLGIARALFDRLSDLLDGKAPTGPDTEAPPRPPAVDQDHADAFWRDITAGCTGLLDLPRPSTPAAATLPGGALPFELPGAVSALRARAAAAGATLTGLMLAVFNETLSVFAGEDSPVIAVAVSDPHATACGVQALPVTLRPGGGTSLRDAARNTTRRLLQLARHAGTDTTAAAAGLPHDGARSPLTQVGFASHDGGVSTHGALFLRGCDRSVRLGSLTLDSVHPARFDPAADLLLSAGCVDGALLGSLELDTARVCPDWAASLLQTWQRTIAAIAADPCPLDRALRDMVLDAAPHPSFAGHADLAADGLGSILAPLESFRDGHGPAVDDGTVAWSHRELWLQADATAGALRAAGITARSVVCVEERCQASTVALLLAVWQLGAAYCPLTPGQPPARRAALLDLARPALVVQRSDALPADLRADPGAAPAPLGCAYIIFTSGTTGTPKAVAVGHRGLHALLAAQSAFSIAAGSRVLMAAPIGFDAAIFEVLLALGSGACLVIARASDGSLLAHEIAARGVHHAVLTPSRVLAFGNARPPLRSLILAGEAVPPGLVQRWAASTRLYNAYGPTEATIWATVERLEAPDSPPLIGHPIEGFEAEVIDTTGRVLPRGAPGELRLRGAGIALGYLGTSDTAVLDGEAMEYRTGDRVRMGPAGTLEFLGRADRQVKLHGVRLSLPEVEAALERHPAVRQAAALMVEPGPGRAVLAAFVLGPDHAGAEALRAWLRRSLPDAFVPALIAPLDDFPVGAAGKLDGSALAARALSLLGGLDSDAGPLRDATEEAVATACEEVLGVRPRRSAENLIAAGANSLTVTRLAGAISWRLGRDVTPAMLWERPLLRDLAAFAAALPPTPTTPPHVRPGQSPLTPMQADLHLAHTLAGPRDPYAIPLALRLRGPVAGGALAAAVSRAAARHPSLAARIEGVGRDAVQVFDAPVSAVLVLDLRSNSDPLSDARRHAEHLARQPFDLQAGTAPRAAVCRTGDDELVLVLVVHHLAVDGWSVGLLLRHVAAALHDPAAQPHDGPAFWDWLADQHAVETARRRHDMLHHLLPSLGGDWSHPAYCPDPGLPETADAIALEETLPHPAADRLRDRAAAMGVGSFALVCACFAAVVAAQQGRTDTVLSIIRSDRQRWRDHEVVGCLTSALPVRVRTGPGETLASAAAAVEAAVRNAAGHPLPPASDLLAGLGEVHAGTQSPLQSAMVAQREPWFSALDLPGTRSEALDWRFGPARAGLLLEVEASGPLTLRLEADPAIFSRERTGRILAAVLHGLALDVGAPLATMAPDEHDLVVRRFNATATPFDLEQGLADLTARADGTDPAALAVLDGDTTWSRAEFAGRANGIAHAVLALGIRPGAPVGVCLPPGRWLAAAVHGVVRSGGAYVPLDPDWPAERKAFIVADLGMRCVLAKGNADHWTGMGVAHVIDPCQTGPDSVRPPTAAAGPDIAYILYTSGSTGQPKAAAVPHRAIVNRLLWMQRAFPLVPADRVLQKTRSTFDVSLWELLWPPQAGAGLVTLRPGQHLDPRAIYAALLAGGVSTVHFVPGALAEFLHSRDRFALPALRQVMISGEALDPALRADARRKLGLDLQNLYGPTEAAIDVTHWDCAEPAPGGIVPIGRPIANTRLYVVDAAGRPAPLGVPGELAIAGTPVGAGYVGRPDLTAARFVPDPFVPGPDARMFRTGDVARWSGDGWLEFFGRSDDQVKVRGIRIEPGEVVHAIGRIPGVAASAVLPHGEGAHRRLVAFVVPTLGERLDTAGIRSRLKRHLPAALVPDDVVVTEALPLTPNGKLDRRALLALADRPRTAEPDELPPTDAEATVLAGWRTVLGRDRIGLDERFFEAGGTSLLLMRLQTVLSEALDTEIPVTTLLDRPTIRQLAAALGQTPAPPAPASTTLAGRLDRLRDLAASRRPRPP